MFIYSHYKNARDVAWQTLIDCNIVELPLKFKSLANYFDVKIKDNKDIGILKDNQLGILAVINGEKYIVIDRTVSIQRQRYTLAHEFGHIALHHELQNVTLHRDVITVYGDVQEYEAERFAIDVLAPACVLWGLNLHSPEEIAKACNISMQSAAIRAERMETLYKRNKFLASSLEKQVYKQFKKYIFENKK